VPSRLPIRAAAANSTSTAAVGAEHQQRGRLGAGRKLARWAAWDARVSIWPEEEGGRARFARDSPVLRGRRPRQRTRVGGGKSEVDCDFFIESVGSVFCRPF
jgi:hypothetical protein